MADSTHALTAWLDEQARSLPPGSRLRPIRSLCREFHLSSKTVARCVASFTRAGKLVSVPGSGIFVPPLVPDPVPGAAAERSHKAFAKRLRGLIAEGFYRHGDVLPSVKRLSFEYRLSPATVITALNELEAANLVTRVGKRSYVGEFSAPLRESQRKEVAIVRNDRTAFGRLYVQGRHAAMYRKCDSELLKYGCAPLYVSSEAFTDCCRRWLRSGRPPFGIVFPEYEEDDFDRVTAPLERLLTRYRASPPVHVVVGKMPRTVLPGMEVIHVGNMATRVAREIVSVAQRSRVRACTVFLDATRKSPNNMGDFVKILPVLRERRCPITFRMVIRINPRRRRHQLKRLVYPFTAAQRSLYRSILGKYEPIDLDETLSRIRYCERFEPEFARHADGLWVFGDDESAVAALSFCRDRRIAVPGRLKILGTENDPAFFEHSISCCSVDYDATGYLLAHAIVKDIPVAKTTKGFIRPPVLFMQRSTL
ncbi:MAG: GntR family transcriptional regulator [Chitinivibrionales bacterium]|nr:GntR family transcriptional regulator [Chitinivibrionales bacterium]